MPPSDDVSRDPMQGQPLEQAPPPKRRRQVSQAALDEAEEEAEGDGASDSGSDWGPAGESEKEDDLIEVEVSNFAQRACIPNF